MSEPLLSADPPPPEVPADDASARQRRTGLLAALTVAALTLATLFAALGAVGLRYAYRPLLPSAPPPVDEGTVAPRLEALQRRIEASWPRGVFVVVDSLGNRLRVFDGEHVLREAVCSSGSGNVLRDPETGRIWVFETPRGERRVRNKVRDPVWVKPDWAFIEEGERPPRSRRDRLDDISLGDYGLYLGDGYIIHGTLFQTLLGQGVTHGCIRLGDEDLEYVFRHVPVGARVFLY
jgi:L,D-transpeptidase YbiS